MEKHSLIRTIYLYIFTLLGLTLLTIGSVRFIDMGLRAFVFTKADEEQRLYSSQLSYPSVSLERIANVDGQNLTAKEGDIVLTSEEKALIEQWIVDYKNFQEQQAKIDVVTAKRHRDASINLALILVGLPLYLYHWRTIKKETIKK